MADRGKSKETVVDDLEVARRQIVVAYQRGSCLRTPNADRKQADGTRYHKGWEIRFYSVAEHEASVLLQQFATVGLRPGRPYRKHSRWIIPVYGREPVGLLLHWAGDRRLSEAASTIRGHVTKSP